MGCFLCSYVYGSKSSMVFARCHVKLSLYYGREKEHALEGGYDVSYVASLLP